MGGRSGARVAVLWVRICRRWSAVHAVLLNCARSGARCCVCGRVPLRLVSDPAEGRKRAAAAWAGMGVPGRPGLRWGGGAPHHRLLASPPGAELLTRRVLELGLCVPAGPHHRLLAPRRRRGERRDISPVAAPGGWLSRVRPQAGGGWLNWGLMSIHGPGRMGEGPNSRPRRFLLAVLWGGGTRIFVFWEVSSLPWQNSGGLIALGNPRRGLGLGLGLGSWIGLSVGLRAG